MSFECNCSSPLLPLYLGSLNPNKLQVVGTYSSLECAYMEGKPFKDIYEQLLHMFILTSKIYDWICSPRILGVSASLVAPFGLLTPLATKPIWQNQFATKEYSPKAINIKKNNKNPKANMLTSNLMGFPHPLLLFSTHLHHMQPLLARKSYSIHEINQN